MITTGRPVRLEIHKGNHVIVLARMSVKKGSGFILTVNHSMSVTSHDTDWIRNEFREACRWAGIAPLNADELSSLSLSDAIPAED